MRINYFVLVVDDVGFYRDTPLRVDGNFQHGFATFDLAKEAMLKLFDGQEIKSKIFRNGDMSWEEWTFCKTVPNRKTGKSRQIKTTCRIEERTISIFDLPFPAGSKVEWP